MKEICVYGGVIPIDECLCAGCSVVRWWNLQITYSLGVEGLRKCGGIFVLVGV